MQDTDLNALKANALAAINQIRGIYGKDPLAAIPRGRRGRPGRAQCPVHVALLDCGVTRVGAATYRIASSDQAIRLGAVLIDFVFAADAGQFPELRWPAYT